MNIDKINSWLAITANFGVILGLVFLGVEVSQSNRATVASTYQARISEIETSYQNAALSDYLPAIYDKIDNDGIDSISNTELRRIRDWETARIYRMQGQYYQYQQGYLDDRSYQDLIRGVQAFIPIWEKVGADINALDPALLATAQK
jgi:hypothetical protein